MRQHTEPVRIIAKPSVPPTKLVRAVLKTRNGGMNGD